MVFLREGGKISTGISIVKNLFKADLDSAELLKSLKKLDDGIAKLIT